MYRPRSAPWTRVISREVDREERDAIRDADLSFVTCDADRATIDAIGARRVAMVPNGVDIDRFTPRADTPIEPLRRQLGLPLSGGLGVFVGSGHPPNVEAVKHLERQAEEYRSAGITVVVVGRCSTGRRPVDNVIHVGEVADVVPYLQAADLALCPLTTGSGTSLKTIEYLAVGLPLITTAFGVRGLDLESGAQAEVCELEAMPARAGALVTDPARRRLLGTRGRAAAERFSWQEIGIEATRALDELAAARPAAS
jgi:glycosyltransferase involved in cell wall biosynthesis